MSGSGSGLAQGILHGDVRISKKLDLGRALGVCPDAIRTHVRVIHVSQCFQGFED